MFLIFSRRFFFVVFYPVHATKRLFICVFHTRIVKCLRLWQIITFESIAHSDWTRSNAFNKHDISTLSMFNRFDAECICASRICCHACDQIQIYARNTHNIKIPPICINTREKKKNHQQRRLWRQTFVLLNDAPKTKTFRCASASIAKVYEGDTKKRLKKKTVFDSGKKKMKSKQTGKWNCV